MSERPSRFEDYVQLRAPANDPYDLTELRYRIGIIDKVCRYCGYDEVTAWKNADKGKVEILYYLIKDANPCLGEALPLDIMEHLQDIMNDYKDDPLGFYEGVEEQVQQIMNSDGEFEDEVDEASPEQDSYWARINGSMDIIQELGAEPFDSPDASSPDSDSSDGDSSVGSQQPPRTPPYLRQDDDLLSQSSSGSVY
ncbi:hypothetical protein MMC17_003533 [Xylographa soralifera]|nr:hypothetical protein [Xylographa soralifera]